MFTIPSIKPFALAAVCVFALASCSTTETPEVVACPACQVIEKIDLQLEGDLSRTINLEFPEVAGQSDLVRFESQTGFNIIMDLGDGWQMTIRVLDSENPAAWPQVDMPYNVYPPADLEDKIRYVSAELRRGEDNPAYSSHLGQALPRGFALDAFRITDNDGVTVKARIRDLVLFKNTDTENAVTVNGTFAGAVTF